MNKIILHDDFNEKILKLWRHYNPESKRAPLLYPENTKGGILFIGLNPSFSEKGLTSFLRGSRFGERDTEVQALKNPDFTTGRKVARKTSCSIM